MFGPDRDSAWAWIALVVAFVGSLLAAPWDSQIRGVAIDGTLAADAFAGDATSDDDGADGGVTAGARTDAGTSPSRSDATSGSHPSTASADGGEEDDGRAPGSAGDGHAGARGATGATSSAGGNDPTGSGSSVAGEAPSVPAGTAGGRNGKGVSDDQVRIGFTDLIGQQDAAGQLGIAEAFPNPGDTKAQIKAVVDWANAHGGIGGRELVPIVREIRMLESSDEGEQEVCTSFIEDQGKDVFAAVLIGTIREQMRQCLADGGVITLDPSAYPMTQYLYDETVVDGIPYLWSPSYPTLNDVGDVLAQHLLEMNYFTKGISPKDPCVVEPCKVGIVMYDFPNYSRLLEEVYEPTFEAVGHPIVSVHKVDSRDAGSIETGLTNAVIGLQRDGVSRVLFMGGAPLGVFFQINAANSGYTPVYGVSTFDQPRFATDNSGPAPDQAHGMRGIGFAPTMDVHDDQYDRDLPMERLCLQIMADAGITFEARSAARIAMAYCQSVMMLREVAERTAPDLDARTWTAAASRLGTGFQTIDGFHTTFSATRRAGSDQFRRFMVNRNCYCTEYVSDLFSFARR